VNNLRAYPIYLGIRGSFAFFFTLWATVAAVYRIEVVHLDPLRLVLLGTALEVAVFFFEVPTGVFADTYGRRRSVITGCILMGCGFALEGAIPEFIAVLFAQAVWGVGYTFISGRSRPGSRTKPRTGTWEGCTCAESRQTTSAPSSASLRACFSASSR
jgi:MFS transporter, DHA3 family, tetracycline resistance protein